MINNILKEGTSKKRLPQPVLSSSCNLLITPTQNINNAGNITDNQIRINPIIKRKTESKPSYSTAPAAPNGMAPIEKTTKTSKNRAKSPSLLVLPFQLKILVKPDTAMPLSIRQVFCHGSFAVTQGSSCQQCRKVTRSNSLGW